jgi:hypothetical protein
MTRVSAMAHTLESQAACRLMLNTALMVATTGKAHMHNPASQKKPKLPQMRSLRNGQLTGMQDQHGKE